MSDLQTASGTLVKVDLAHRPVKGFWLGSNNTEAGAEPDIVGTLCELVIDIVDGVPKAIQVEFVVPIKLYRQIEANRYFSVDFEMGSFSSMSTPPNAPVHMLLSLDMSLLSPNQFGGLDIANNRYDLEEVLAAVQVGWEGSPFRAVESWQCLRVEKDPTFEEA